MWWWIAHALAAGTSLQEAEEAVRVAVSERTGHPLADVEVRNLGLPETTPPAGHWEVELPNDGPYCGTVSVRLTAVRSEGSTLRYNLRPHVTIWTQAPRQSRSMAERS
jgi:hypothetical protein